MDYTKICFVIMPFGEKSIIAEDGLSRVVNFDAIYDAIFDPAIRAATMPDGGQLEPRRTDKDFFAGDISQEMFEYLEYSRMVVADITGLNANVFYELGVRHRARVSGTVVFRQLATRIPFDINQIKAFPYEYEPEEHARESKELVERVLTESLEQNRIDSPVQRALIIQRYQHPEIERFLRDGENAVRVGDRPKAIAAYREALRTDPGNNLLHFRVGLLLKDEGKWSEALEQFKSSIAAAPAYAEAYRELGIAENKLFHKSGMTLGLPNGIPSLLKAIELSPDDYDAHASLGGALKREGRLVEAQAEYERAAAVSRGHTYPLLNAIKLRAHLEGKLQLDGKQELMLKRAERSLRAQVASDPPYDAPWSFFDLAETCLYRGKSDEFLSLVARGAEHAGSRWQVDTFRESLELLSNAAVELPGLREGVEILRSYAARLD